MKIDHAFKWLTALVLAAATVLTTPGCSIPTSEFKIGVPHREQTNFNYCVPASILMWRLWDGLPEISQESIFIWLGGPPCTADEVPAGVNHFTHTFDARLDIVWSPTTTEREHIVARQIQSVGEYQIPVIPVVGPSKNHVGVINGGRYHASGNVNVWDYVYFHDPASFRGDDYYGASQWLDFFCSEFDGYCAQIISNAATSGWLQSYQSYGHSVDPQGGCATFRGLRRRCD